MSHFQLYKSQIGEIAKRLKKSGTKLPKKRAARNAFILQNAKDMINNNKEYFEEGYRKFGLDFATADLQANQRRVVHEMLWAQHEQHMFIEDATLLDRLLNANVPGDVDLKELPYTYFALAIPEGYKYMGVELEATIIRICTFGTLKKQLAQHGITAHLSMAFDGGVEWPDDRLVISYFATNRDDYDNIPDVSEMLYFAWPILLADTDVAKCFEKHRQLDDGRLPQYEAQRIIYTKLIVAIAMYSKVFPDAIKSGIPAKPGVKAVCQSSKPDAIQVTIPAELRNSISSHYRAWHFRRYPKRQDGTRREGLVFVKPTLVNADKRFAKTVEER